MRVPIHLRDRARVQAPIHILSSRAARNALPTYTSVSTVSTQSETVGSRIVNSEATPNQAEVVRQFARLVAGQEEASGEAPPSYSAATISSLPPLCSRISIVSASTNSSSSHASA